MTFKAGDIVTHVLDGPKMQVKTVHSEKLVECFWFDDRGAPHERGFNTVDLAVPPAAVAEQKKTVPVAKATRVS